MRLPHAAKYSMKNAKQKPIQFILFFYLVCFIIRTIEYHLIRTDQSNIGEAFIHKTFGIVLLGVSLRQLQYKWQDIGFRADRALRDTCFGLLLGIFVFLISYSAEIFIQTSAGNAPSLQFYVTSYAIQGNRAMQDGALFILICIIGNLINVVMEEGVFRGLFVRLTEEKYSFIAACVFSSLLFGIWHISQPIRNFLDGLQSFGGSMMTILTLVVTSTLLGIQYVMLNKLTGSIWAGMAAHFVNNTTINLLHVVTNGGADEMQTFRIAVAQALSFVIVLVIFLLLRKKRQPQD